MTADLHDELKARPLTMVDMEAIAELRNDQLEPLIGLRPVTEQQLRSEWQSPDFDLEHSSLALVTPVGHIAGSVIVWDHSPVPVSNYAELDIHPDYVETTIGQWLIEWAERRAQESLARAPENARVILRYGAWGNDIPRQRLLEAEGKVHIRTFYTMRIDMDAPPPAPQWPEGIRVRTFDRDRDEIATFMAEEEVLKDHWGYIAYPFEQALEVWRSYMYTPYRYDPSTWFLAMDGDEIAGYSLCGPTGFDAPDAGCVVELGVRRPWRRKGLATALLRHSFGAFWQRGKRAVALGVDADSLTGATKLYEKVGMRILREWRTYEQEMRPSEDLMIQTFEK